MPQKRQFHASSPLAWFKIGSLGSLFLLASACTGSRGGSIPYEVQNFGQPDAPSSAALDEAYRIAPLDQLSVSIFQVKDLSGQYEVDLTGNIAMPLLGNVQAVDKTPAELQADLENRLGETYLRNPNVTVGVVQATGSKLTVEGAVEGPGLYPIFGKMTLLQAIAMAKGLDKTANPKRVAIFRQIDGQRMAAAFDLTTIRSGEEKDPQVYRGDIIVVEGSGARQAFRDVLSSIPIFGLFRPLVY